MSEIDDAMIEMKAAKALLAARRLRWDNVHQGECFTDARAVLDAVADDIAARVIPGAPDIDTAVEWARNRVTTIESLSEAFGRMKARAEQAEAEREHFAQATRDTLRELKAMVAERDDARHAQYLAEQDRDDHAAREAEAEESSANWQELHNQQHDARKSAEAALSRVLADVEGLPRWSVPPGYTGETGAFITGEVKPALVVRWADLDTILAKHRQPAEDRSHGHGSAGTGAGAGEVLGGGEGDSDV